MNKNIYIAIMSIFALCSCNDTNELITPESNPIEIKSFQAGILSAPASRATITSDNLGTAIGRGTYNSATNTINFDNDGRLRVRGSLLGIGETVYWTPLTQ